MRLIDEYFNAQGEVSSCWNFCFVLSIHMYICDLHASLSNPNPIPGIFRRSRATLLLAI